MYENNVKTDGLQTDPSAPNINAAAENNASPDIGVPPAQIPESTENKSKPFSAQENIKKLKKVPKKFLLTGIVAIAAIILIAITALLIVNLGHGQDYALYVKDKELYFTDLPGNKALQVTTQLIDDSGMSDSDLASSDDFFSAYCYLARDGKTLFFIDKMREESGIEAAFDFYYRNIQNKNQDPVKIDSNVIRYTVNDATSLVTYMKYNGSTTDFGTLYQYDIKKDEKTKIIDDAQLFYTSEDGKKIGYLDSKGNLYLKEGQKESEKIDSDVTEICYWSIDLSKVFYLSQNSLYQKTAGKDKVRISADNVYRVQQVYETGEVYYLKAEDTNTQTTLINYINDDMQETDATITKPDYPWISDYPDYESYNAAYEAYDAAYDLYLEKLARDDLRTELNQQTIDSETYSLYYYNGKEEIKITDRLYDAVDTSSKAPAFLYRTYNLDSIEKINLSEVSSVSQVESKIEQALEDSADLFVAVKDNATQIELTNAQRYSLTETGDMLYYIGNVNDNVGELYQIPITDNKLGQEKLYDSEVYTSNLSVTKNGQLLYFKNYKNNQGDLYFDQKLVDYEVYSSDIRYDKDQQKLVYFTGWQKDSQCGTLKIYSGGKAQKVDDDVHQYTISPDGKLLYLNNYNTTYFNGELQMFDGRKSKKLDDDVTALIHWISGEDLPYRGIDN